MPNGVVKQELQEVQGGGEEQEEEQEEAEVIQGSGAGDLAATEDMEEPQINLRLGLTLFHCRACLLPLKPPTFKCEAGHVVCGPCRNVHGQVCGAAATFAACVEVDAFVRDAKQACVYDEFGCKSFIVYYEAADHHRACPWAPCSCPDPGCAFFSSPARLVHHFAAVHSWPVAEVSYGKPYKLAMPPAQGWHVLVGEEDRCVFLVSHGALGEAVAVSLVCVRENGDAAAGAPQFRCKLWAEVASNKENVAMMMSTVGSSNLSGGFSAVDQRMFLAVPPDLLHDVTGEPPVLMVRVNRAGAAAVARSTTTPPSRSSRRLQ